MSKSFFRYTAGISVACCLFGLSGTAWAAPSFRSDKNYPNLGLRIRVLDNSTPEPLAQFKTYTYTFTRGEETSKRDMFDPREIWYGTQHAGQWRDKDNNILILGRPTLRLPLFDAQHVLREDFDKAIADPAMAFDPASADALAAWIKNFASCTPKTSEQLNVKFLFNLSNAVFFPVEDSSMLVYAFRVKGHKPNNPAAPNDWFVAVIKIGDGTPASKVRKDFEMQFLANVADMSQSGASSTAGVQSKAIAVTPAAGKTPAGTIAEHPSRIAARKSIANMKGWWYAETREYIFLSNIRSNIGKSLVKELQTTMPVLRGAFAKLIPPFEDTTDISVVRIYEEPEGYKQYVGKDAEWSDGIWSPMHRELVILSQGNDKERTMEVIRHEGFHQYLFYASGMIDNAMWFNEGHACFFDTSEINGKGRVEIPENQRVVQLLENLDIAASQLPELLNADRSAFYSGTEQQRSLNYANAWALIYFLRKGAPSEKLTAYASILDTYRKTLASTRNAKAATAAAFEGINMATLQKDFADFWKKGRNSARRFDVFAEK